MENKKPVLPVQVTRAFKKLYVLQRVSGTGMPAEPSYQGTFVGKLAIGMRNGKMRLVESSLC
jgi:hypothetical protein